MTREEALKVASEMHGWLRTDREKEALETLVPELKESEDERIRKYIINFIKLEKGVNLLPDDADRMLAYLEKQKEQMPEGAYNYDDLYSWYIHNVSPYDKPLWSEEHLKELLKDFIVIPKENNENGSK